MSRVCSCVGMLVGVSSSGNLGCGVMSSHLAVRTSHGSVYDEQNKKQAYVVPCKEP